MKTANLNINENTKTVIYACEITELKGIELALFTEYRKKGFTVRKKRAAAKNSAKVAHKKEFYINALLKHADETGDEKPLITFMTMFKGSGFNKARAWFNEWNEQQKMDAEVRLEAVMATLDPDYVAKMSAEKAAAKAAAKKLADIEQRVAESLSAPVVAEVVNAKEVVAA